MVILDPTISGCLTWVLGRCSFVCPLVSFWVPQSGYPELLDASENIQISSVLKHDILMLLEMRFVDEHRTDTDNAAGAGSGLTREESIWRRGYLSLFFHDSFACLLQLAHGVCCEGDISDKKLPFSHH